MKKLGLASVIACTILVSAAPAFASHSWGGYHWARTANPFGLSFEEARRRAPSKMLPCPAFRLGGQKSPWLVSVADLAELIDQRREKARY